MPSFLTFDIVNDESSSKHQIEFKTVQFVGLVLLWISLILILVCIWLGDGHSNSWWLGKFYWLLCSLSSSLCLLRGFSLFTSVFGILEPTCLLLFSHSQYTIVSIFLCIHSVTQIHICQLFHCFVHFYILHLRLPWCLSILLFQPDGF